MCLHTILYKNSLTGSGKAVRIVMKHVKVLIDLTDQYDTEITCNNIRGLIIYKACDLHWKWKN